MFAAISTIFINILPLYLLALCGYLAGRWLEIKSRDVGRLALFFLTPAVVFSAFTERDFNLTQISLILFVFIGVMIFGFITTIAAQYLWSDGRARIASFGAAAGNTGFFGIPAAIAIWGEEAFTPAVIFAFGSSFYEISIGYYLVSRASISVREAFWRVLKFPALYAFILAVAIKLLDLSVPKALGVTVDMLRDAYSPLGMMIVGLGLAGLQERVWDARYFSFITIARLFVAPLFALAMLLACQALFAPLDPLYAQIFIMQAMTPVAAVTVVHAAILNVAPARTSFVVAVTTLLVLLSWPIMFALIGQVFPVALP